MRIFSALLAALVCLTFASQTYYNVFAQQGAASKPLMLVWRWRDCATCWARLEA